MQVHTLINTGLNKGLFGIMESLLMEQVKKYEIVPVLEKRIRLTAKFNPMIDTARQRIIDNVIYKRDYGTSVEDTIFLKQANGFFVLIDLAKEIVNEDRPEFKYFSAWLRFEINPHVSQYFTIEICNRDGKVITSGAHIKNLVTVKQLPEES